MVQSLCLLQRWVIPCQQSGTGQQSIRGDRHLRHSGVRQQLNDAWQDWKHCGSDVGRHCFPHQVSEPLHELDSPLKQPLDVDPAGHAPLSCRCCVTHPLCFGNVPEIIMLISLTLSQLSKVCDGLFPYTKLLESDHFFFFLSQALHDPLGSGRSWSSHSQVTCFPFWVLALEKLMTTSEFLHCPARWIIAHHSHPNAYFSLLSKRKLLL